MPGILGLRASPRELSWALVDGEKQAPELLQSDHVKSPKNRDDAGVLSYFRQEVERVIAEYTPSRAVIRGIENNARANRSYYPRCRLEGVLLAVADAHGIPVRIITDATIRSGLATNTSTKDYVGSEAFRGIDLTSLKAPVREALIVAASELEG